MVNECEITPPDFTISFNCDCPRCKSKAFGITGICSSGMMLFGILISVLYYPNFDFSRQFISDLGMISYSPAALWFNITFIIGGLFLMVFSLMILMIPTKHHMFSFGATLSGLMTGFAFFLVGFCPLDIFSIIHAIIAIFVFIGIIGMSGCFTMVILFQEKNNISKIFGLLGLIVFILIDILSLIGATNGVILDLASRPDNYNIAIIEWITLLTFFSWIFTMSLFQLI